MRLRHIVRPRRDGTFTLDYWLWRERICQERGFRSEAEALRA